MLLPKLKVLFLCTGNSCRSQMAEGWARALAVAGLESHGKSGLLRSVAVASPYRDLGLGRRLVDERVSFARKQHLDPVYLLTTTAAPFFRALGFEDVKRRRSFYRSTRRRHRAWSNGFHET